ncbi:hypothetical protein ACQUSR_09425 [Streptomyces sp. P1-3]|uniref:hypothetical protein n=1 Tax=Streptomyces sp. P1-3 TaxID=3421658 RepID=UPI003D3621F1
MPAIDTARRRLRLADSHVSVLGFLVEEEDLPDELSLPLAELKEAGIVDDEGGLAADLYPLLSTLMEPHVIVRIEVTGSQGVVSSGAVIGDDFMFTHEGWPGEDESEYVPVEPPMLVWALSRMVDLHREAAETPDASEEIVSTMGALDGALERIESGRVEDFGEAAAAAGAPHRLAEVLANLNCMWRMTVAWRGSEPQDNGMSISALAAWDCGIEGYWIRESPAEPVREGEVDEHSELRVRRTTAKELWQKITDLLPDADQLLVEAPASR